MFTKPEIQVIAKTLLHRREWLGKNIDAPEMASTKAANQQTLELIDSVLNKLGILNKPQLNETTALNTPVAITKAAKPSGTQKHADLTPDKMKVLIVDDDLLIGSLLQALLSSVGIQQIDVAQDGLKAITMLYDANPVYDLVLCDWNMPIKNGLDVHNAMRAAERYIDTCFMLVTAVTEAKQIRAAIDEGVDDYVVKPIEEHKIIAKIARHFPKIKG